MDMCNSVNRMLTELCHIVMFFSVTMTEPDLLNGIVFFENFYKNVDFFELVHPGASGSQILKQHAQSGPLNNIRYQKNAFDAPPLETSILLTPFGKLTWIAHLIAFGSCSGRCTNGRYWKRLQCCMNCTIPESYLQHRLWKKRGGGTYSNF